VLAKTGVVAGGEPGRADSLREGEQRAEAEATVAAHARVRRLAARVAADERLDDSLAEGLAEIERDVREPEGLARLARRDHRGRRAAHTLGLLPGRIGPEAKRDPDRLVAGIAHAKECDGAVDAAAHRDGDAAFVWSRRDGCTERVVKRIRSETLAGNRCSVEERTPLDLAEKPRDVAALSDRDRAIVALRYFAGLTEAETGVALACPIGTVKSRLSRAIDRLRDALREEVVQ